MKINRTNKLLLIGLLLYIFAGIMAITGLSYSSIILLAAIIFLAFGFFVNVKFRWDRSFKKKI
jgi:hypothetical protein|tara:strand:+ start:777 stop:965 length:189 start_codon:yes stop_codon:yes gene_type:complete